MITKTFSTIRKLDRCKNTQDYYKYKETKNISLKKDKENDYKETQNNHRKLKVSNKKTQNNYMQNNHKGRFATMTRKKNKMTTKRHEMTTKR